MAPALAVYDSHSAENQKTGALGKTTSGKQLRIRTYPKFNTLDEERLYRKQHLAAAFRVFADRGFDEGVAGHISVRDPILTDHFCTLSSPFPSSHLPPPSPGSRLTDDHDHQGSTRSPRTSHRSASRTSSSSTKPAR